MKIMKCFTQLNIYSIWILNIWENCGMHPHDRNSDFLDRPVASFTKSLNQVIDRHSNSQFPNPWTLRQEILLWFCIRCGIKEWALSLFFFFSIYLHVLMIFMLKCPRELLSKHEHTKIKFKRVKSLCWVEVWPILLKNNPVGVSSTRQDAF